MKLESIGTTMESPEPVVDAGQSPPVPEAQKIAKKRDRTKDQLCSYCGAFRMDRQHKDGLLDFVLSLFSAYPYRCRKCLRMATKFFFTFRLVAVVLFLSGMVAAAVWGFSMLSQLRLGVNAEAPSHVEAAEGVRSNMGQLSSFEKMMLSKHQQTIDNDTVVRLTKSNIGTPIILKMIRNSNHDFDTSANAIIGLKNAGVDEAVIFTMLDLSSDPR
jgi:hypothetical protein